MNLIDLPTTGAEVLTPRMKQVISLLAQGHSNKAIGDILGIKDDSVEIMTGRIAVKIGLSSFDKKYSRRVLLARWWWLEGDDL